MNLRRWRCWACSRCRSAFALAASWVYSFRSPGGRTRRRHSHDHRFTRMPVGKVQFTGSSWRGPFLCCNATVLNPYHPPDTQSTPMTVVAAARPKTNLPSLLIPAFVGAFGSSIVLAPWARGPGDPTGQGIAFALGGVLSLFAAVVIRGFTRRRAKPHPNNSR